jgi:hypothetical protein
MSIYASYNKCNLKTFPSNISNSVDYCYRFFVSLVSQCESILFPTPDCAGVPFILQPIAYLLNILFGIQLRYMYTIDDVQKEEQKKNGNDGHKQKLSPTKFT